jgi:CRISPR system Cascade subunit CasD
MRLKGPMQSWGTHSYFSERDTSREPTKSGVLGIICAAMGLQRDADLSKYSAMRFGVRVNKEGKLKTDFQTGQEIEQEVRSKRAKKEATYLTHNHYLADADYIVGFESKDRELLERIQNAFKKPKWLLCLGKKSYAPSLPIYVKEGIVEKELIRALEEHEIEYQDYLRWDDSYDRETKKIKLRFAVDDPHRQIRDAVMTQTINDNPVSFEMRLFRPRYVTTFIKEVAVTEEEENVSD